MEFKDNYAMLTPLERRLTGFRSEMVDRKEALRRARRLLGRLETLRERADDFRLVSGGEKPEELEELYSKVDIVRGVAYELAAACVGSNTELLHDIQEYVNAGQDDVDMRESYGDTAA